MHVTCRAKVPPKRGKTGILTPAASLQEALPEPAPHAAVRSGSHWLFAHQHHQFQILAMRGLEGDLVVDDVAVARMVELAPSALAAADVLRRPEARERVARGAERVDQRAGRRIGTCETPSQS